MSIFAYTAAGPAGASRAGGPLGEGINVFQLDRDSGALSPVQTVTGLQGPSYLARHPTLPLLYAVERMWSPEDRGTGALTTFAIDPGSGQLSRVGRVRSGGKWPAHLSVHPSGRWVLVANPGTPGVASLPLGPDGLPGAAVDTALHQGRGPNQKRQQAPYPHSVWPDVSGRFALACDLGTDRVMIYRLDQQSGALRPAELPFAQVSSGAGARHLAFHPSNRFVYIVNELDSTLSVFSFDGETGALEIVQTIVSPPEDFTGFNHGSHAIVHPAGRFLYSANRGHDSLTIFAIDQQSGRLRRLRSQPTGGETPRNFTLAPGADLLLAGNQKSGTLVSFRVEQAGAELAPTGHSISTPAPVCVELVVPE